MPAPSRSSRILVVVRKIDRNPNFAGTYEISNPQVRLLLRYFSRVCSMPKPNTAPHRGVASPPSAKLTLWLGRRRHRRRQPNSPNRNRQPPGPMLGHDPARRSAATLPRDKEHDRASLKFQREHTAETQLPIAFSAQYQQSPIPPGGTIVKRKWFVFYDVVPTYDRGDHVIMSWDIALSEEEKGDYSACVVLLRRREVFFVLEVIRQRLRFDDLRRKVLEGKKRYGDATLLIEDSAISKGLIQSLEESSLNVTKYAPDTDKRNRLIAQCDLFAGGSVRLPARAPWLEDFTAELLAFPGRHDDQVDALTQGLAWGRSLWSQRARFDRRAVL